jgi:hypothetical protein
MEGERCIVALTFFSYMQEGIKFDCGKPDYSLVPPTAFEDVVKVLTYGASKYDRENWRLLDDAENRYFAACMRHLWARKRGEIVDPESGLDHGAHAICSILFLMELYNLQKPKTNIQSIDEEIIN